MAERRGISSTLPIAPAWLQPACQDLTIALEVRCPVYSARVLVSLRPSVLDPAGEATRAAASRLGVEGVSKLRIGKAVELDIEAPDLATARERLSLLSDRLLANPVIEDWSLDMAADSPAEATASPVGEG
jgi:phosphoribosylformylglycinamidine synthase